jgi:hypothetical protein
LFGESESIGSLVLAIDQLSWATGSALWTIDQFACAIHSGRLSNRSIVWRKRIDWFFGSGN